MRKTVTAEGNISKRNHRLRRERERERERKKEEKKKRRKKEKERGIEIAVARFVISKLVCFKEKKTKNIQKDVLI